jgi:hypothetical protein
VTPELRKKIELLIAFQAEGNIAQVTSILEALSDEHLAYVIALAWWGRGDGSAGPGEVFESVLSESKSKLHRESAAYARSLPFSIYLPKGLERLGIA